MKKKSNSRKVVATFGAAMTAMYMAPDVEAGIVDLTNNLRPPNTYQAAFGGTGPFQASGTVSAFFFSFDFIGPGGALDGLLDFAQDNANAGRKASVNLSTVNPGSAPGYLAGLRFTATGNTISAGQSFATALYVGSAATNVMFGFLTTGGNVGWMKVNYNALGVASPIQFVGAAYENMGGSIVAGVVPEPSSLGGMAMLSALALGAGRRSRRKKTV
ncbi:MAG: PEP-CTERM sorting domain-containing protein [Pirellulaceae bacterium]